MNNSRRVSVKLFDLKFIVFVALMVFISDAAPVQANGATRFNDAVAAQWKGDLDDALTLYSQALREGDLSHKQLSVSAYNRGIIYLSKQKYALAIADFDTAIWLRPAYADAFHNRGLAHSRTGRYERAITDFSHALKLKPENPSALNNRGNAYRAKNEFDKSIVDYDKAIIMRPDYGFGFYNRGLAFEAKAIAMESVASGETSEAKSVLLQVEILWRRARQDYETAATLLPDHPVIKAKLAQTPK
jgi:tetratricopeptide (TPR) repeat protein